MEITGRENPSAFAQIVDILRNRSEEELRLLYIQLYQNELIEEWKTITNKVDFGQATEEDIVKAIQKNRNSAQNV